MYICRSRKFYMNFAKQAKTFVNEPINNNWKSNSLFLYFLSIFQDYIGLSYLPFTSEAPLYVATISRKLRLTVASSIAVDNATGERVAEKYQCEMQKYRLRRSGAWRDDFLVETVPMLSAFEVNKTNRAFSFSHFSNCDAQFFYNSTILQFFCDPKPIHSSYRRSNDNLQRGEHVIARYSNAFNTHIT